MTRGTEESSEKLTAAGGCQLTLFGPWNIKALHDSAWVASAHNFMSKTDKPDTSLSEENRYRLLIEAVIDYAIHMLDPKGIVSSWNPGPELFKDYSANEIIGQHFSKFYTEEDREDGLPWRALAVAAREGKFESEGWRVRKDGSRFWAAVLIDPRC